jgi:hypothetical protein
MASAIIRRYIKCDTVIVAGSFAPEEAAEDIPNRGPRVCLMFDSPVSAIDRGNSRFVAPLFGSFVFHSAGRAKREKAEGGAFI